MNPVKIELNLGYSLSLQEEFAPCASLRGSSTGVVRRAIVDPGRDIEGLRGRTAEGERQVEGLFVSVLALSFVEGLSEVFNN